MQGQLSVTIILVLINAIIFIAETTAGGSRDTRIALKFGAQYTPDLERGQWWRMFTSMFVHFGVIHIISNMYALYSIGTSVESMLGSGRFLLLYLFSGSCGNLFTYLVEKSTGNYAISAGASGAIFGLMGFYLMLGMLPQFRSYVPVSSVMTNLAINLVVGFTNPQINMKAHIGGLFGGMLCALMVRGI